MTPERWERLKTIFDQATDLPAADRPAFLDLACAGDDEVRRELKQMLESGPPPEDFLELTPIRLSALMEHDAQEYRLAPGDVLCERFRIESFLGHGGMGEVYSSYDTELKEPIALKTIRGDLVHDNWRIDLLRREVQQARKIVHPSVCRVYDLFTHKDPGNAPIHFITMELLRGELLDDYVRRRGPVPAKEALPILKRVADALTAAHQAGIVHRDLKCSNVFLVVEGDGVPRAVVTDFGLARNVKTAAEQQTGSLPSAQPMGTLAYMAPEQIQGARPTIQSDLYSLGLVAYELLTGHLPFPASSPLQAAILRSAKTPPPPSSLASGLPAGWDGCITRCLDPDPAKRFETAGEFVKELSAGLSLPKARHGFGVLRRRLFLLLALVLILCMAVFSLSPGWHWWNRGPLHSSIAVLPFANVGADPEAEYLSDGITEEIISLLSKIGGLRVVSRNSTFRYKGQQNDLRSVAKALGAEMILMGTVRRAGTRIRVTAELVDPQRDHQLWSRTIDREMADVFAVQDEIATMVADSLRLQIGRGRLGAGERRTQSIEAFDLYLKGR